MDEGSINTQIGLCTKHHQLEYENEARFIAYEPDVKGLKTIKNILSNRGQIKYYQMRSNPEDIYNLSSVKI
mgnify:CR=1 FL=1